MERNKKPGHLSELKRKRVKKDGQRYRKQGNLSKLKRERE
jgi:hypothetical protein